VEIDILPSLHNKNEVVYETLTLFDAVFSPLFGYYIKRVIAFK
jgi:hypothetical protein